MPALRIGFMGTPDFAVPALRALHAGGHEIACAYTRAPQPKGRGHKVQNSPVHEYAQAHKIPVYHPVTLKNRQAQEIFKSHSLDVAVVAAYGLILPPAILDAPRYGCINIHASLLPRWRGASPIQRAIWAGDAESGVTLMQMDEGLDTGAMIAQRSLPLTDNTTALDLHDTLAALGSEMVVEVVHELAAGNMLNATPQDDAQSTYAPLLSKEDGRIDWQRSAVEIDRQIRALNPWPGTWSVIDNKRFKMLAVEKSQETSGGAAGTVLNERGDVACGEGVLTLTKIQPENAKVMHFSDAVRGGYIRVGGEFS